jgi:hypothetical protein
LCRESRAYQRAARLRCQRERAIRHDSSIKENHDWSVFQRSGLRFA